jgi:hypothetical protein
VLLDVGQLVALADEEPEPLRDRGMGWRGVRRPRPERRITAGQLDALGVSLAVEYSSTAHLRAVLDTPNGRLTLT